MFRCYSYTIIRERINLCLLKLQLLKQSIKLHRCVVNTVVVWLHILGSYRCLRVALFGTVCFFNGTFEHSRLSINGHNTKKIKNISNVSVEFN